MKLWRREVSARLLQTGSQYPETEDLQKQEQLKAVKGGDQCGGYKKESYDMSNNQGTGSMKP